MRRAGLAVVAAIGLAACGGEDGGGPRAATSRDSGAIRIVENRDTTWADGGWSVGETPLVDIGGRAGETAYDFSRISGVVRLRDGRLAEAFELINRLEDRGAATEAQQLMVALGCELGRYDEAAKQAAKMGSDTLAQKLKLRAALSRNPREAPPQLIKTTDADSRLLLAKILAARQPERALEQVRAVRRQEHFRAEAIALEVKVLERLGREDEAVSAREQLQFADPAFVSGPRTVAGSTSTGSQTQVSLAE